MEWVSPLSMGWDIRWGRSWRCTSSFARRGGEDERWSGGVELTGNSVKGERLLPVYDNVLGWYAAAEHPALAIDPEVETHVTNVDFERVAAKRCDFGSQCLPS